MITNVLKHKIRTGWEELGISSERLESVAEHIYGCLMLAIAIDSEYKLDLDMYKVPHLLFQCISQIPLKVVPRRIHEQHL